MDEPEDAGAYDDTPEWACEAFNTEGHQWMFCPACLAAAEAYWEARKEQ